MGRRSCLLWLSAHMGCWVGCGPAPATWGAGALHVWVVQGQGGGGGLRRRQAVRAVGMWGGGLSFQVTTDIQMASLHVRMMSVAFRLLPRWFFSYASGQHQSTAGRVLCSEVPPSGHHTMAAASASCDSQRGCCLPLLACPTRPRPGQAGM